VHMNHNSTSALVYFDSEQSLETALRFHESGVFNVERNNNNNKSYENNNSNEKIIDSSNSNCWYCAVCESENVDEDQVCNVCFIDRENE
jgi:hypothetical protein